MSTLEWKRQQCKFNKNGRYYLNKLRWNATNKKRKLKDKIRYNYFLEKLNERKDKAGYFNAKKWEQKEIKYLQENYQEQSILNMALYLGRSYCSVARKLNRLNLHKNHKYYNFKESEL